VCAFVGHNITIKS